MHGTWYPSDEKYKYMAHRAPEKNAHGAPARAKIFKVKSNYEEMSKSNLPGAAIMLCPINFNNALKFYQKS